MYIAPHTSLCTQKSNLLTAFSTAMVIFSATSPQVFKATLHGVHTLMDMMF